MPANTAVGGPVPASARKGRENQRYGENGERLIAGCIPVRFTGDKETPDGAQVLQVTSRGGTSWVFPKGGWENDEDMEVAAKRETVEEAGVRGNVEEPVLGPFPFQSKKKFDAEHGSWSYRKCMAHMFVLHVEEELVDWPEQHERQRGWASLKQAAARCRYPWMRDALLAWVRRQGWTTLLAELQSECACDQASPGGASPQTNSTSVTIST